MTDNFHQTLQDIRNGKTQPTTADWYILTRMFNRHRMRHIINSMPNEATARAVAEAISTQWHQLVKDMGYLEMWEVAAVMYQNGSEAWHCALTPPLSEYNNIVYEHIEDVLHTYITEFTTNNRQGEESSATPATATTPPPPAPEKEEEKPAAKRKAGRKPLTIDDNETRMMEKAKELKQLLEEKGLEPVITTTKMEDELNQVVVNFMVDWAQERKTLQQSCAAAVWRFLTGYCGFADSDRCAANSWKNAVPSKIPELFKEKQKMKKK